MPHQHFAGLLALTLTACGSDPTEPEREEPPASAASRNPIAVALEPLRERELELRERDELPWSEVSGPDPQALVAWDDGFVGLLRGASAVVHLDARGRELGRVEVPAGAVDMKRRGDALHIVGERSNEIAVVEFQGGRPVVVQRVVVADALGLRAVAPRPDAGGWYVADRHRGRILEADGAGEIRAQAGCLGALDVQVHEAWVVANCMLEHRVRVFSRSGLEPVSAVTHDGPIWAMAPRTVEGTLELALAGVEDHPLDRSDGSFGYIDSFVFRTRLEDGALQRIDAVNVGAHGVVTPKALAWREDALWVTGAGGDALARIEFEDGVQLESWAAPAGLGAFAWQSEALLAADALLDRWVYFDADRSWSLVSIEGADERTPEVRLGEALVFTTLMAPQASAEGRGSRFTCETCHFEGTVDGRVHFTGRGEVYATTKTLRGLVGNQPHFSRALDRSTTDMIHNEFRVANANTPQDPWFTLDVGAVPWLSALTEADAIEPAALRAAVLEFLAVFDPEPNPATFGRSAFTALERRGATQFETLCEACHQARTVADDPQTRLPRSDWEAAVFDGGGVLWASDDRYRTGVQPYVHEDGPRVPSLRRLWVKRPYLTQGTAADLAAVLAATRTGVEAVHGGGEGAPLSGDDQRALLAFLELL